MQEGNAQAAGPEKKRSLGKMFLNFLMYGGWLVIVILGLTILVVVSKLTQS